MSLSINTNLMASNASRHLGSHYGALATSIERLSSGLRINSAADDAAGLAIRELMRADISSLNQGIRNANDAISLIQTADGALGVIDEKLIRMKELAEQASTGTYSSDQRLMIDREFQDMAAEIDRIAKSTEFNGIKLLDGSRTGQHDGSGLESTGALKVHFGSGNDSAEDYYYMDIGNATLAGLGLSTAWSQTTIEEGVRRVKAGDGGTMQYNSGLILLEVIPKGTKDFSIQLFDHKLNDTFQLFTTSGKHIAGTVLGGSGWRTSSVISDGSRVVNKQNGFAAGAVYDGSQLNGTGADVAFTPNEAGNVFTYNGMTIGYSGDGNPDSSANMTPENYENLTIDEVTEDLILMVPGRGVFSIGDEKWEYRPYYSETTATGGSNISIPTQELAQRALDKLDTAIIRKDKIRAHLGAMQNRLENTVSNLQIQAENLQAAESRISDVDVSEEMTGFVRNQILTQSATAMLAQANSIPSMIAGLIG